MTEGFSFEILKKDKSSRARLGIIKTKHGNIETPYLVPVATRAEIIALSNQDLLNIKPQAILANTYHLHFMSPGDKAIKKKGGLHKLMRFPKPIFTDSGGFQALSLGIGRKTGMRKLGFLPGNKEIKINEDEKSFAELTENGIMFTSSYNENEKRFMGPKESMKIQSNLGSDIIMAFDQCNPAGQTERDTRKSMLISHKWELESLKHKDKKQALYGIVHGGVYKNLRKQSCQFVSKQPFDGIAIGGAIGKNKNEMYELLDTIIENLQSVNEKPRHMLGIGWVDDIFECVSRGIDTFDCVQTTRVARHGNLYVSPKSGGNKKNKFKIKIRRGIFANDKKPIDKWCGCPVCKKFTRAELHKLQKSGDLKYGRLATIHNLSFMEKLTKEIRDSIKQGNFQKMKDEWLND